MAVISKVRLVNMALSNLGARSKIESLSEESVEAREADLWYDYARLATLQAYNWKFATKRQTLSLDSNDAPCLEWTYRYQLPADCVRARYLENPAGPQEDAIPFDLEIAGDDTNRTIVTDLDQAVLVYTFDQQNTELFSPGFVEAFSYKLAAHLAMPVSGKIALKDQMLQTWATMVRMAAAYDANEGIDRAERDSAAIRARGYTWPYRYQYPTK